MKRVPSGITGLDRLIQGGFPEGSTILVSGPPGTGKTIFGLQFLVHGARKVGEPGLIVQAEEFDDTFLTYDSTFKWKLAELQEKELLAIYSFKPKDFNKFTPEQIQGEVISKLETVQSQLGIKRVVIDTISPLGIAINNLADYRRSIYELIEFFKEHMITALLITEGASKASTFNVEEHLCDGTVMIDFKEDSQGEFHPHLMVSKMMNTNFPMAWYPVTISSTIGFNVRPFS